jgi:hypothetical protein
MEGKVKESIIKAVEAVSKAVDVDYEKLMDLATTNPKSFYQKYKSHIPDSLHVLFTECEGMPESVAKDVVACIVSGRTYGDSGPLIEERHSYRVTYREWHEIEKIIDVDEIETFDKKPPTYNESWSKYREHNK